ncbi:reverse transcriptase domain-containing protein [Trichonephila inaurata madagascariensis]|uniref:Reverse transcriptase domain-containing protein n=1 Tax=Trichonephila inaurata madagascariensis TaxID=2747483 RepID=A0A8X6YF67_9ARAC|nr:reverse transcriptase domain-containing protein [Trichonephila inaurata madagascariensis]
MTSAMPWDIRLNATASGSADAPCPEVRGHADKCAMRTLNILQLIINGTQKKLNELSCILHENNIPIVPSCKKQSSIKTFSLTTEAHAINILLPKCLLTIINVYHPNNSELDADLIKLLASSPSDIKILLGDLNAKSPSWGSPLLDSNGNDLLLDLNLSTLNTGETTYLSKSNGATSAIDITAIDIQHIDSAKWRVVKSAISDHFPIITTINLEVEPAPQNNSWNFRKGNWDKFTDDLDSYCSQITDFNNLKILVQSFNRGVQKAAQLSIPRRKRRND